MHVLVLNPCSSLTRNVIRDVMYGCWCNGKRIGGATVPPFALVTVATILRPLCDVSFVDAQAEQLDLDALTARVPEVDLIISSTSTMSFTEDASILLELKRRYGPDTKTAVFGSHPTFLPRHSLSHEGVDIGIRGEPEVIVQELVRGLMAGDGSWKKVLGTQHRGADGAPVLNPDHPFLDDLDTIPFPDVTLLPEVVYYNPLVERLPYMTTTTSKGCPAKCTFCTAPYFDGMRVRFQSAEYMVNEVKYFVEHGIREVYFRDDTFFIHKKRDKEFCRRLLAEGLDIKWIGNARVAQIDQEMMEVAREAGCHVIKIGVESGSQHVLDRIRKGYQVEQAYDVFRWAKEAGIDTHAHVMIGNPGDTVDTIKRTIDFVLELAPTTATFGICTPYPGTPLYDEVRQHHPEIGDSEHGATTDFSRLHKAGEYNHLYCDAPREFLETAVQDAYRRFYLRPRFWWRTASRVRSSADLKRFALAGTRVVDYALFGE